MEFSLGELLVIALIAFLVLGPEDFVRVAAKVGRFVGKARDQINNYRILLEEEVMAKDRKAEQEERVASKKKKADSDHDEGEHRG